MVISNAKYDKKQGGIKNRAYVPGQDDDTSEFFQPEFMQAGADMSSFGAMRLEELEE